MGTFLPESRAARIALLIIFCVVAAVLYYFLAPSHADKKKLPADGFGETETADTAAAAAPRRVTFANDADADSDSRSGVIDRLIDDIESRQQQNLRG